MGFWSDLSKLIIGDNPRQAIADDIKQAETVPKLFAYNGHSFSYVKAPGGSTSEMFRFVFLPNTFQELIDSDPNIDLKAHEEALGIRISNYRRNKLSGEAVILDE